MCIRDRVASISAKDQSIGQIIAESIEKVGRDGVITVEESKSTDTTLEAVSYTHLDVYKRQVLYVPSGKKPSELLKKPVFEGYRWAVE